MLIINTVKRDCGWLPDQTIQLIANIYTIIKFLVPLLIIIMGSIDFLKAVMAQQEDQIKKAQSSFLQKLIAGALVFFVAVIVGWIVKVISDLDTKGETTAGNTFTCLNLMLNGGYRQNNKDYFTPGDGDKDDDNSNSTTSSSTYTLKHDTPDVTKCVDTCIENYKLGTYIPKFTDRGIVIDNCKKAFDYDNGEFGMACRELEDCFDGAEACEDITKDDVDKKNCSNQYNKYIEYKEKYNTEYVDNPSEICEEYAETYLKNNIANICINECDQ